ncbi:hypothetical protein M3F63_07025 [Brachybacterium muris]|uniref:hypothetical protein n=1 Tax=Brachybacterium muris TaxID=219301 RepID=UPI00223C072B|nr:hypothetical protein [Brachybacterium muris]MCT2177420.1 hypothetical protein [Brachybacterium muris]
MIAAHFEAIRAIIEAANPGVPPIDEAGRKVHDTDAGQSPKFPYIVLWGGDVGRFSVDVAQSQDEAAGTIGVTCTALTARAARSLQSTLADLLDGQVIRVPGRHAFELVEQEVRPVMVDRDVQIPTNGGGSRYPFYGVLTYRVESTSLS